MATTRTRPSWLRRIAIACIRCVGRCSTGFRPKGCSSNRRSRRPQPISWSVPDAGQDPEQILGLAPGLPPERQFARLLADAGCELLIPVLIRREPIPTTDAQLQKSQQTWREWLYRQAFHMGRHPIGYEVQKVLAAVDGFRARRGDDGEGRRRRLCRGRPGGLLCGRDRPTDRRRAGERVFRPPRARLGGADRSQCLEPARTLRRCRDRLARAAATSRDRTRRESVVHEQQGSLAHAVGIVGARRVRPHSESRRLHASRRS